jgi:hypothetical protein
MKTKNIQSRNAVKFMTIIACVGLLFLLTKCKRETGFLNKNNPKYGNALNPTAQSEVEIENQLKMIARGYASVNNTDSLILSYLHNYLILKDEYIDAHLQVNPDAILNINLDIEDEVNDAIDNMFTNSGYDRDYFYGFNYSNCYFTTGIAIGSDEDEINLNNPVVFVAESADKKDTVWAYYWNNGLDSIELHNENVDDYFVFVITAEAQCDRLSGRRSEETGCNNNGICEPMQGETPENCDDCQSNLPSSMKKLEIIDVTILEDKKRFDESYLATRYELGWDWLIANYTNGLISYYRNGQSFNVYNNWRKKHVPRQRNSNLKGNAMAKIYKWRSGYMWDMFNPDIHDIYLLFWEHDKFGRLTVEQAETDDDQPIQLNGNDFYWLTSALGNAGTFHKDGSFKQGGLIHIPAGSTWEDDPNDPSRMIITAKSPGLEEIEVKLGYK